MLILRTFVRIYIHICIQDKNNIAQIKIKILRSDIYLCNCILYILYLCKNLLKFWIVKVNYEVNYDILYRYCFISIIFYSIKINFYTNKN